MLTGSPTCILSPYNNNITDFEKLSRRNFNLSEIRWMHPLGLALVWCMLQPINDHMPCETNAVSVDNHPEKQLFKSWWVERPAGICYQIAYSQEITRHVFTYFLWYQSALPVVSSTTRKLSLSIFTIIPLSSGKHESCMMSPIFTYDLQTLFQNILETSIIPFNHDPPYAEMENWTARKSEPIVANVLN